MARPYPSRPTAKPCSGPSDVLVVLFAWVMLWVAGLHGDAVPSRDPSTPTSTLLVADEPPPAGANRRTDESVDTELDRQGGCDRTGREEPPAHLARDAEGLTAAAKSAGESDPDAEGIDLECPEPVDLPASPSTAGALQAPRSHGCAELAATRAPPSAVAPVA